MSRVIAMLLVHDIGEIDVGDVIAFAEDGWEERQKAELAAVTRIAGLLPESQAEVVRSLWQEFDEGRTAESRLANAVDRAMPVLQNLANEGQSWRENGISHERVVRRVGGPIREGCPALWEYLEPRLEEAREKGWFGA
jgi:putative hydrolase of HD superfamily